MGKILSTTYKDTVQNITGFYNDLVNNPFYLFNGQKPVVCIYYNQDKTLTSMDPGSKLIMDNIGSESPLRFNRIYDFLLYGFDKIQLQTDLDEYGVEADKISGECVILPNTFVPLEGDYFEVEHIKSNTYLFIVTDVQKDTLDNGSNGYKISYKLEYNSNINLVDKVVHNYRTIESREGTNITQIVRCEDYDIAKLMDERAVKLKQYFCDLYYNGKVQTFTFEDLTDFRIYDQYLIEFLMRNEILENGLDTNVHVMHQIPTQPTFAIDYDKTFFRAFEEKNLDRIVLADRVAEIEEIHAYSTIFASRYELYFKVHYIHNDVPGYHLIALDEDLVDDIRKHKLYTKEDEIASGRPELWRNIIVKYFRNEDYTDDEVESIDDLRFEYSKTGYYIIPLLIFCLEKAIINTLKR